MTAPPPSASDDAMVAITLPARYWSVIDRAFLPSNPNKLRGPMKEFARDAALAFKAALARAAEGVDQ